MLRRLDVLDSAIAETEARITEQVLLIVRMEVSGLDVTAAKRMLGIVEGLLVEYHRARDLVVEAKRLTNGSSSSCE